MSRLVPPELADEGIAKVSKLQDQCNMLTPIIAKLSNSSEYTIGDAIAFSKNEVGDEYLDEYENLVERMGKIHEGYATFIPDLSENDTLPEFCGKVDQAAIVFNSLLNNCNTVGNFKYRSTYCDSGYWCGCFDPTDEKCKPSNDTTKTYWAGHYTKTKIDPLTNQTKSTVYVGWAEKYPSDFFRCEDTLYCPGKFGSIRDCPKLCTKGHYCPNSTIQLPCPKGSYCLIGSTEPRECSGIYRCDEKELMLPSGDWFLVFIAVVTFVLFLFVLVSYRFLNKRFPFHEKTTETDASDVDTEAYNTPNGKMMKMEHESMRASFLTTPKPSYTIDLKFNQLQLTLKNNICIMKGVTGELKGGQFTAIMGPSGAGKSTFLSLLSGKTEPTGGTLVVNGEEASLKDYRKLVGFVPQEDIMLRELTVEENIRHSALMRLPEELSRKDKLDRVYKVMESLDLLAISNSVIGDEDVRGISGGQRKRVNVAMELVADPSLLALDEPTTGLDSTTSSNLCATLSMLAASGVNVMAVIHQPKVEILEQFTNVLLLGVGGKTVYMGPTEGMGPYFTRIGFPLPPQMNPADYYMDVISGLIPCENNQNLQKEDLFDLWANSPENSDYTTKTESDDKNGNYNTFSQKLKGKAHICFQNSHRTTPGTMGQTFLLLKRAILQRCRRPSNTAVPLCLSAFAAVLIGYMAKSFKSIYYGVPLVSTNRFNAASQFMENYPLPPVDMTKTLWLFTALVITLVCIVSINTFGLEKAVFLRESFSGTNATSYWLAKSLETGAWLPLHAAVFVVVCYGMQPLSITLINFWLVIWISMIGFSGIGHIVSLLVGRANRGIVHLISCLILVFVFSGVIIQYQGKKWFQIVFTFWNAQSYAKGSLMIYEDAFAVDELNQIAGAGYNLKFSFAFDIACSFLTAIFWHFVALAIIIYRSR